MSVTQGILLLFIGYLIFTLDKKQENIPVPTILVFLGIGMSFIPYFSSIHVTEHMIYHIFLPPLLFVSAYRFPPNQFKKHIGIILFLATAGILLTVGILGVVIYTMSGPFLSLSLIGGLLLASILTPTDPVSVVSILKKSTGDEKIADVVEGESLINDGTSIVIFSVLLGLYTNQQDFSVSSFLSEFLLVSLGGTALGIAFGWLMSKGVHYTHNKEYQVMLSIVLAYGIFNIAEGMGVSGVLATVFAGLMLSFEYGRTIKENHFKESLDGFWSIIESSALSLLFLLIGIEAVQYLQVSILGFAFIVFVLSMIVRFIIITGTTSIFHKWRKRISWRESTIITWSGLKGSMSVFLILSFQASHADGNELLLSLSFTTVLISLILQSLGVYPLSKKLL
ncbi:cation:proton antiporter [Halobacillus karajensis]|uniref:Sodium, potassium, lithium and rubidium/H(+) antiporter n=1 Tax=Halobacillus karajensis TaxID=195088 RepID=A0A024P4Y0_9BACI|nr:sodium:proton antiporter [Halobacillus karajensis]CDQ20586.1 Sodium, potassium, lithium and rubidium/H(+) antiporter [Halobacillus karajensis]CDQ23945.1 Sodium, potassium, lithium and rubidium/H(+) antiporter [Halobacillus karajensis]CDQ27423.1 Sodium, potassium, lithium and rubidium/H(+) antiporter [Halobacillus karajensis]